MARIIRWLPAFLAVMASVLPVGGQERDEWVAKAREKHGEEGAAAARFLVENMPERDRGNLDDAFLAGHLDLAFAARREFPWAAGVPEEIFFNDVVPYAVMDETREAWRGPLLERARPLVRGAKTASEAAMTLNRELFKTTGVRYDTNRRAPNQSPLETLESGKASCTGLSILLVAACRAVGIPARAVGTPLWTNRTGNHTWVEIWDNGWQFMGAAEPDPGGLNRAWFVEDAARATDERPEHAIYATSWKREGAAFPLVWNPADQSVGAVRVTERYARSQPGTAGTRLGLRLWDKKNGERLEAAVWVLVPEAGFAARGTTRAGTADRNDMPRVDLPPGAEPLVFFGRDGGFRVHRERLAKNGGPDDQPVIDANWDKLPVASPPLQGLLAWAEREAGQRRDDDPALRNPLDPEEARIAVAVLAALRKQEKAAAAGAEMEARSFTRDGRTWRWLEKEFGPRPPDGRSLWISLHGGGNAPPQVNDAQWRNQLELYQPAEGIYAAPRAPTNTWNLWHEAHVDTLMQEWIDLMVATRGVNPEKVYLLGYSAGGDGVWQLAPRMADRFAAAAMMAGHPNEAVLPGLRNLPFALFMGADDAAYNRNKVAAERAAALAELQKADPGGYTHLARIYPGLGHWMNGKDAEALPWMAKFKRQSWPRRIVWIQDDITHTRFYWLARPPGEIKAGEKITASVEGQRISLEGDLPVGLRVRLSDELVDLERPVEIVAGGAVVWSGKVARTAGVVLAGLRERLDPAAAATAEVVLP